MADDTALYFIAIIPPKSVYTKIRELQFEMFHQYSCKKVLKSPTHLTLQMPFKRSQNIEKPLIRELQEFCENKKQFDIQLRNFSCFKPHVIFVQPEHSDGLMNFRSGLVHLLKEQFEFTDDDIGFKKFNPHFTLAFRDLKPKFWEAWKEFENREFHDDFTVDKIFLFKHNSFIWEILKVFDLG
jgi:2'-5' RNA ligase